MAKPAATDHPVNELIQRRWSPRAFADRPVEEADLRSLFEAARWAPSSSNEQPWRFIVARREERAEFERLLACLTASNQRWAKSAAVLVLSATRMTFERNGKPNRHAFHDVGLAASQLVLQATSMGMVVHQMAGFDVEKARQTYEIPPEFEPVTAIAMGYVGAPDTLPDDLRERELAPRERRPQSETVFSGGWGRSR